MRIIKLFIYVCIVGLLWEGGVLMNNGVCANEKVIQAHQFNFSEGETIVYAVKKFGLTIGHSRLSYHGLTKDKGRELLLITFKTQVVKFVGLEKIYLDPKTFYPVIVERDIDIFGKKEDIVEEYSQQKKEVKITKKVKRKTTERLIEREAPLENVQGFIFRYRKQGKYIVGEKMEMMLPLSHVKLSLLGKESLEIEGEVYETYCMEGHPRELKIWFDTSEHHVPLRIDGNFGVGRVSLVLDKYKNL